MQSDSPPTPPSTDQFNFKQVLPIFIIVFVNLMGVTIILPLLGLYATRFEASPFVVGLLGSAYPAMQFIGAPILGRLSDRYGRKPVLIVSQIGTLIGFLILGFATTLPMLFLSRIIDGISGANISTAQAAITDVTTEKNRTQGLGLIGAAFGLGFVLGPAIAGIGLALSNNDYRVPAFIAAGFSLTSIILTLVLFKETLPEEKRGDSASRPNRSFGAMAQAVRNPAIGLLLILIFAQQLAFGGFEQLLALFTLGRLGLNAIGNTAIFIFIGLIIVVVQGGLVGRWSRRFGDRRMIYAGLALLSIGLLALAFTPRQPPPWYSETQIREELDSPEAGREGSGFINTPVEPPPDGDNGWFGLLWLLAAMAPVAVGGGILQPTINSLITKRVSPQEVGGILGVSAAFLSLANVFAPVMGGLVLQAAGATMLFLVWGTLMGTLYLIARRNLKPGAEEKTAPGIAPGGAAD